MDGTSLLSWIVKPNQKKRKPIIVISIIIPHSQVNSALGMHWLANSDVIIDLRVPTMFYKIKVFLVRFFYSICVVYTKTILLYTSLSFFYFFLFFFIFLFSIFTYIQC